MTTTVQQFDYDINMQDILLWQYNNAANYQALIAAKDTWYANNHTDFWQDWYTNVFNLATADDFGLSVWSIILDQPITLPLGIPANTGWGFSSNNFNFGNGNFQGIQGSVYRFPTQYARIMLQLRYFCLVSSGTVPEINRFLKYLFGTNYGGAYVLDHLNMTMEYVFQFLLPPPLVLAFENFDLLPRPAGVKALVDQVPLNRWGFGSYNKNYGNGNFVVPFVEG